ncbi:hypothetical protein [Daejeonella lutea]|uniref:Uncharacterized protein n=1 Tax=Daejeonella lutea TaxID=572036 RepID=A0A1T5EIN4_9SPHI|nr:hypothetical protein [Daejeonella lutea]SKB83739.1 hypothetical protein SAMN05661099_3042 [Daejeonella lutea]
MIEGINFITDEKGHQKGIILDLPVLKKHKIKASEVIEALSGLQQLIDNAEHDSKEAGNWGSAKETLKNLHP